MASFDTDILIVGAGPCGLMLANELGTRGISAIVVDREETVATAPQANATQARSMEHYRRHGFAEEIRALGMPSDHPTDVAYFTTLAGWELGRFRQPPSGEAADYVRRNAHIWNAAEMPHRVAQSMVEQTLLKHAAAYDTIDIRFDIELNDFTQDSDGVVADLTNVKTGKTGSLRARYLFAADGAQSAARRKLGIRYEGGDPAQRDFMGGGMLSIYLDVPDFHAKLRVDKAWMYWIFNARRRGIVASVDGVRRFGFATQVRPGEIEGDVTFDDAARLFRQALGRDDIDFTVTGLDTWTSGRKLVAPVWGKGRVLLGGDAVHLFTPTGGMGYNTAIEDAVNIGWKYAAVLRGEAPASLLDSYEAERRPAAVRNTSFAAGFADAVGLYVPSPALEDDGPAGELARARAGAYLAEHGRNEFTIPGFTLGVRYDGSPIVVDDGTRKPPDLPSVYAPSAKPGGRAPHFWMEDGSSLFDNFGPEWTLLLIGSDTAAAPFTAAAKARGVTLTVLDLTGNAFAADLYNTGAALIRPDQMVAWRGDIATQAEADTVLATALGAAMAHAAAEVA